jgi:hypothetical protein
MEGAAENRLEKSFPASTLFAASEGWNASQNTYSLRLLHIFELGKHSPPTDVSTLQHDVLETLKPAQEKRVTFKTMFTSSIGISHGQNV